MRTGNRHFVECMKEEHVDDIKHRGDLGEYDEHELVFHPDGRVTRKQFLLAGGGAALGAAMGGPLLFSSVAEAKVDASGLLAHLPYTAHTNVKGTLEFWHFWSSPLRRGAIHAAIRQFTSVYKGIHINDLPVPAANIFDKLHAAVAAQSGVPDVNLADRLKYWVDAKNNLYIDLSPYNAKDKVNSKAFFPVTWQQCNVRLGGKTRLYGLPFETDSRVLYINRAALADAGISPNFAPKTWSQLQSVADKLDQKSGSNYSRITFWPFDYDMAEFVWLNGGSWETSKGAPTANSSKNVATGDFMKWWADRYGHSSGYNALAAKSNPGVDMFASGLQVFHIDQPTYQDFTLVQNGVKFVPKTTKYANLFPYWNVGYLPYGPGAGGKPWTFSGGYAIGVPRKKQRSSADTAAAWEFAKFMSFVGQLTFERYAGNIPCVISMTKDPFFKTKLHWSTFVGALKYQHKLDEDPYDSTYPDDVLVSGSPDAQTLIENGMSGKDALDKAQQQALLNMKRTGGP